jgi:large subunit ribosomal protein L30
MEEKTRKTTIKAVENKAELKTEASNTFKESESGKIITAKDISDKASTAKAISDKASTAKAVSQASKGLIAVVRIVGEVKVKPKIVNTLYRLRLRRKYSCVLVNSNNKGLMGMLWRVRHSVAYGEIDKGTLVKLLEMRGKKLVETKIKFEEAAEKLILGKNLEELGFKPFFRLHPPRKGIDSKLQYPKGVLGNNKKDINKLIERML